MHSGIVERNLNMTSNQKNSLLLGCCVCVLGIFFYESQNYQEIVNRHIGTDVYMVDLLSTSRWTAMGCRIFSWILAGLAFAVMKKNPSTFSKSVFGVCVATMIIVSFFGPS